MSRLAVLRTGERAAQYLNEERSWTVQVVSRRSFWLMAGSRWVACVADTLGGGPLQMQIAGDIATLTQRLKPGDTAIAQAGVSLRAGGESICLRHADSKVSASIEGTAQADVDTMLMRVDALIAAEYFHQDGLMPLLNEASTDTDTPVLRRALPAWHGLREWARTGFSGAAPHLVLDLVGLGPGLTPSGDDFLSGVGLALRWTGCITAVTDLSALLKAHAQDLTTPLSACCLEVALDGYALDAVHELLMSLEGDNRARGRAALRSLDATGHTSGWDMVCGIRCGLGLASLAQAHTHPHGQVRLDRFPPQL